MINKELVVKLVKKGFIHIFSSNVINKFLLFATSIILVRVLTKEVYGRWSYANNILTIFLLFKGLGVANGVLQYGSTANRIKDKIAVLKLAFYIGVPTNLILSLIILIYSSFFTLPIKGSREILFYLSFTPILMILFELAQVYFRATLRNREYSFTNLLNTLFFFLLCSSAALLFKIPGVIAARYISLFLTVAAAFFFLKKDLSLFKKVKLPPIKEVKDFIVYSLSVSLANALSFLLYTIDTFLVGLIIKDEAIVASYKTATLIPTTLIFIPQSIMVFMYPYFARMAENRGKVKSYLIKLQLYLLLLNSLISVTLIVLAPFIINLLFGPEYSDAVLPFRILSIGYLVTGTFRITAGNIIASLKKVKVTLLITSLCAIINVILDYLLITKYSAPGAALATLIVFTISAILANIYLFYYLKKGE